MSRLLRTREFPIDRAEIETTTNPYGPGRSNCAAVIDAADRGLARRPPIERATARNL